ncbi:phenylalanine--tRNA ligase subunit beta [Paenibacillus naphthalenovorans]|uniref:Phenylalanine--tRNA ligase beta subunit n=1 Tax=Paenibacillus naphthalenovorans TaxID=162209 RepID=A0A0U2UNH9_9BACL|nr:phenylalanine--tRNA ligase subunit beta [Paenibacillus naphthalenovorans]ALS23521.1 subunit beta of phenylalanyl-tRNA synthetase [Paenibacillus naphthalenovorans]GCL74412.1 phenylalanine--tRNA ligase subunit beta [Paenibacillus naphthalenovorans]SDJ03285.1 phenylalanyl-tRNA synthetase beta chain [Paenibacillus naphthalenovorans]
MKVSYEWLSQYVDISGNTAAELAEKLTRSGIEVDIVENRNKGVEKVVVGFVKSREKHPDADKLSVCIVDAGQGEDLQIVCGAKNVAAGQKVPVALIGAKLPGGLSIKRSKLRGVESQGMICSAKELGLNDKLLPKEIQEGILVLPEDTEVGASILDVLALNDEVMDLDLTPNRSDCLSMLGTAYEIGAILGREVKLPDAESGLRKNTSGIKAEDKISVEISAKDLCSHYAARLIEGVRIGKSPLWLQNRLMAAGIRPINNIVDITNYVMLEFGQPLHAFDADKLANGHIDVRLAREGEKLVTLDDVERTLEPHMLLITDGTKPVAIAGVMGGANSEVTEGTTRIVLESAKFDGGSVRKTSRQLGLRSEASLRFEKEVNPEAVIPALNRAASLIAELAGGQVASGVVEAVSGEHRPVKIEITVGRINSYLGTELSAEEVKAIFGRLNFAVEPLDRDGFRVHVPSRRGDITRAVDLIEEVARLHGYDHIPTTLMNVVTTPGALTREQSIRRVVRTLLTNSGLHEAITYSFTHPEQIHSFPGAHRETKPVALAMPMSEERSVLRTSLVPHLLDVAAYNRNRNINDVAVFEIGRVFLSDEETLSRLPEEKLMLAILLTGKRSDVHWTGKPGDVDFYDLKGIFEGLVQYLGIEGVRYVAAGPEGFHPGRCAQVEVERDGVRKIIGTLGQLHPALQQQKDLADTYVLEVEMDALTELAGERFTYDPLPRYPAIIRDMALVVDRGVAVGDLLDKARETAGSLLESIQVFDVYTGERLGADKKSVAISLVYRTPDRTLTDNEVSELHGRVVAELESAFAAVLRK